MSNKVIGKNDIKRTVSMCVAAKASRDINRQVETMRQLVDSSVVFLERGGSLEELCNLAYGKK